LNQSFLCVEVIPFTDNIHVLHLYTSIDMNSLLTHLQESSSRNHADFSATPSHLESTAKPHEQHNVDIDVEIEDNAHSVSHSTNDSKLELYSKWKRDGLHKMKAKATQNVAHRSKAVEHVITGIARSWDENARTFQISKQFQLGALNKLFTKFQDWSGVDVKACKNKVQTFNEYYDRADNWFNRNKGEWFGDYYFTPIFHQHLRQYCTEIAHSMYSSDAQKESCFQSLLYAQILRRISYESIRFKQTRPQSLVIDQSLVQSNKLQSFLLDFASSHDAVWALPPSKSAKAFRDSWRQCINQIHQRVYSVYCRVFGVTDPSPASPVSSSSSPQQPLPTEHASNSGVSSTHENSPTALSPLASSECDSNHPFYSVALSAGQSLPNQLNTPEIGHAYAHHMNHNSGVNEMFCAPTLPAILPNHNSMRNHNLGINHVNNVQNANPIPLSSMPLTASVQSLQPVVLVNGQHMANPVLMNYVDGQNPANSVLMNYGAMRGVDQRVCTQRYHPFMVPAQNANAVAPVAQNTALNTLNTLNTLNMLSALMNVDNAAVPASNVADNTNYMLIQTIFGNNNNNANTNSNTSLQLPFSAIIALPNANMNANPAQMPPLQISPVSSYSNPSV